ncbi:hypothetical protein RUND412_010237 [Rhizina undulata]
MDDLMCIDFSSDEESTSRTSKLQQTEEAFQAQKVSWRPICQSLQAKRRLHYPTWGLEAPSKEEALEIKAAAEERYYSRDYKRALALIERALRAGDEVHPTEKKEILYLRERCGARLNEAPTNS